MTCFFFFFFSSVRENNSIPSYNKGQGASKRKKMTRKKTGKKGRVKPGPNSILFSLDMQGEK